MEIRALSRGDIDDALSLSAFAFQYELTVEQRAKKRAEFQPEQHLGAYVDHVLAAKLAMVPLQVWIHGQVWDMGGIAGVATWPEYRRQGMVGKLLRHALQAMREAGQSISMLHPFEFPFYRKYGWANLTTYKQYSLGQANWPRKAESTGSVRRLKWNRDTLEQLDELYQAFASRYNGMLKRDAAWWNGRVMNAKDQLILCSYTQQGEADGYMIYSIKNQMMKIQEMVFLTEAARWTLWQCIGNHDSMIKEVQLRATDDDQLAWLLDNPRFKQELVPYFMARIVDAEAFLRGYPFQWGEEAGRLLHLKLADPHAPWNEGVYMLEPDDAGGTRVTRMSVSEEQGGEMPSEGGWLVCGIGELTGMLLGSVRPGLLLQAGQVLASEETAEQWERRIPQARTALFDFF